MSEQKRQKRFQIHLSTALVLMIAAGGLVWANLKLFTRTMPGGPGTGLNPKTGLAQPFKIYGWPLNGIAMYPRTFDARDWIGFIISILINLAAALVILFAVWFVCEWWIRWRAALKQGGGRET